MKRERERGGEREEEEREREREEGEVVSYMYIQQKDKLIFSKMIKQKCFEVSKMAH